MQASRNGVAVAPPQHWATFMEDEGVELREQVPLAPYTTLGLGGEARYFVECGSEDEVRAALTLAADGRLPVYVVGGGSNVVFLDSGFPGLVLRITIGGVEFRDGESPEVRAGAGVDWDGLVQAVVARGWTGVECLSGIPGTVGGTPLQNVGDYGQEIAVGLVRQAVLALRRSKSMVLELADPNTRSAGSFFTNPVLSAAAFADLAQRWKEIPSFPADGGVKVPAAWLVEHAGFPKGYRGG